MNEKTARGKYPTSAANKASTSGVSMGWNSLPKSGSLKPNDQWQKTAKARKRLEVVRAVRLELTRSDDHRLEEHSQQSLKEVLSKTGASTFPPRPPDAPSNGHLLNWCQEDGLNSGLGGRQPAEARAPRWRC